MFEEKNDISILVEKYFAAHYTYKEICKMLEVKHGVHISLRSLQRYLQEKNLKRKNIIESPFEKIILAIMQEHNDCGLNLGYRSMWLRLRKRYDLTVKQNTVLRILNLIDPEGVDKRSRYKLKRRQYKVRGPNHVWHIDGFDKLKKFGFAIHGCVDGFSRKVLWLKTSTTNNNPKVIAYYYLKCVQNLNCVPSVVRSDKGTENTIVEILQQGLRHYHTDEYSKGKSFIKGKSTANERIEKFWRQLINHSMNFYIKLFKLMVEENVLDIGNTVHIECLRFCFSDLISFDLDVSRKEWNEHRVRKQNCRNIPSDIPNILFHWPEKVGARDCRKEVAGDDVQRLLDRFAVKPDMYNPKIQELVHLLMPKPCSPSCAQEAYDLFMKIMNLIKIHDGKSSCQ